MSSFFFNDTATTEIYTLSLHDALPISGDNDLVLGIDRGLGVVALDEAILGLHDPALGIGEIALCVVLGHAAWRLAFARSEEHTSELQSTRSSRMPSSA